MRTIRTILMLILAVFHLAHAEEKNQEKPEMDVSMAVQHYQILFKADTAFTQWPAEYFNGYPQSVLLKKEVNSLEDVTSMLNARPQKFKDQDIAYSIMEHDGYYVVALLPYGHAKPVEQDEKLLQKAYVIKKGTKNLFCWMNW